MPRLAFYTSGLLPVGIWALGSAAPGPCPSVPLAPVAATADTTPDATADADP